MLLCCICGLAFFTPLFFFNGGKKRFTGNISISSLSRTACVLPATAVCVPVVHRQKCCQLNNRFCLQISRASLTKTNWFPLTLGFWDMSLEFVWFLWVSLLFVFIFYFFICVYLLVCLFPVAFIIRHCTSIKINENNEPWKSQLNTLSFNLSCYNILITWSFLSTC